MCYRNHINDPSNTNHIKKYLILHNKIEQEGSEKVISLSKKLYISDPNKSAKTLELLLAAMNNDLYSIKYIEDYVISKRESDE